MKSFSRIRNQSCESGFTLVELLLVMAIIAVLSSLALVVVGEAQYDAQANATSSRINQISTLMQEALEEYAFTSRDLNCRDRGRGIDEQYTVGDFVAQDIDDEKVRQREVIRRVNLEVLSSEMPRNYVHIAHNGNGFNATFPSPIFLQWYNDQDHFDPKLFAEDNYVIGMDEALQFSTTFLADQFRNPGRDESYDSIANFPDANEPTLRDDDPTTNSPDAVLRTSSEYLYFILQRTQSQGILALESLGERAFADTDGDGNFEVVDSWGNPIGFFFELYDMEGNLINPNLANLDTDLDSGFVAADDTAGNYPTAHFGIPLSNVRMRIFSTGDRELDSISTNFTTFTQYYNIVNSLETLITN